MRAAIALLLLAANSVVCESQTCADYPFYETDCYSYIVLSDVLDEDRGLDNGMYNGYCLDIVGHLTDEDDDWDPSGATIQAHTCKNSDDQYFVLNGTQIYCPKWDLCVSATAVSGGAGVESAVCDSSDALQQFTYTDSCEFALVANPSLCLSVSPTTEDRNGDMFGRDMALRRCDVVDDELKTWTLVGDPVAAGQAAVADGWQTCAATTGTAPTASPTSSCADDATWHKAGNSAEGCSWIAERPARRCSLTGEDGTSAQQGCPATCDACTNAVPTASPTSSCADDATWLRAGSSTHGCLWVAERPAMRCSAASADGMRARRSCLVACNNC